MQTLEHLLEIKILKDFDQKEQIDIVGSLFDLSFDERNLKGIEHAFDLSKQIDVTTLDDISLAVFHYVLSNGWSYIRKLRYGGGIKDWSFQTEELTNEIVHLRKAISSKSFADLDIDRQCSMYTNLANSFSYIGRFVEAQEYWNKALLIYPEFAMAIGNRANGLMFYGASLYDDVHNNLFQIFAFHGFKRALEIKQGIHPDAMAGFLHHRDELYAYISGNFSQEYATQLPNLDNFDLGSDKQLLDYRTWCLENRLFINPLNDLGPFADASHDCLNLPTLTLSLKRAPVCINMFNQIKQEFATARYCFYASQDNSKPHFSDVDVVLVETMELVKYSYYIEQLKISFRLTYSILDKIAYLLNDYLNLEIEPNKVSFRGLWYKNSNNKVLRPFFTTSENWALRGLFWLSKDLYEKEREFDSVLEPEAKEVASLRNFIEHKGFKVVSDFPGLTSWFEEPDASYSISRKEFELKAMKLLKLTRAAIIYVAIAISKEEDNSNRTNSPAMPIVPSEIPIYTKT